MTLGDVLENQDSVKLSWGEPWSAMDRDQLLEDDMICADVEFRATARDCIRMQRYNQYKMGKLSLVESDRDLLLNFMAIHGAAWIDA